MATLGCEETRRDLGGYEELLPDNPHVAAAELANGLTLWVRPHRDRMQATAVALVVGAGSLIEEDEEQGFAHLIEHLAFHGGTLRSRSDLERLLDSHGVALGRDRNALTSLEHTVYRITLRQGGRPALEAALDWMADIARGLALAPEDVEAESRVVLEERRSREGLGRRLRAAILAALAPGSRLAGRDPLGNEQVLAHTDRDRLRAFYRRWYRPEHLTLVVTGPVEPEEIERLVEARLGDWQGEGPVPTHALELETAPLPRALFLPDPEEVTTRVRLVALRPALGRACVGDLRDGLVEEACAWLAGRRAADRLPAARLILESLHRDWRWVELAATDGETSGGTLVETLALTATRAAASPITEHERTLARTRLLRLARGRARAAGARSVETVVTELIAAVPLGRPPLATEDYQDLAERLVPSLDQATLAAGLAHFLRLDDRLIAVSSPKEGPGSGESESSLVSALRCGIERGAAAVEPIVDPQPLPTTWPAPGEIAERTADPGRGLLHLSLGNGIRAHVRAMDTRPGRVHVALSVFGGQLREDERTRGLTVAAARAFARPTTREADARALADFRQAHGLKLRSLVEEDALTLHLLAEREDLEPGLRLLQLMLGGARIDPGALETWRDELAALGRGLPSIERALAGETMRLLGGGDARFTLVSPEQARAITLEDAERWLERELAEAPLELAVVGDIDPDAAADLLARTLGSLASRLRHDPSLEGLRRLSPPVGPAVAHVEVDPTSRQGAVLVGWRAAPCRDLAARAEFQVAAEILTGRLLREVREAQGLVYEARASYSPSRAYREASLLSVALVTAPERLGAAEAAAREVVARLARSGPEADELAAARLQLASLAERAQGEPKYWARALAELEARGLTVEKLLELPALFAAVGADDARQALARSTSDERQITVFCHPARRDVASK